VPTTSPHLPEVHNEQEENHRALEQESGELADGFAHVARSSPTNPGSIEAKCSDRDPGTFRSRRTAQFTHGTHLYNQENITLSVRAALWDVLNKKPI